MKTKVLVFTQYFVPSIKAGGPIQSIKNIVENMSEEFEFYIVTSDRDLDDKEPFRNVETNKWTTVNKAQVYYTDPSTLSFKKIRKILKDINYDVLYLNSFFSKNFSIKLILLKKLGFMGIDHIILSPRGEFSPGALSLKYPKKKLYITLAQFFKLYDSINWHATTINEKEDIKKYFSKNQDIQVANNLTENYQDKIYKKSIKKIPGKLNLVYLGRIHPTKNLKFCLELLLHIKGEITFDIYGPIQDKDYWKECKRIVNKLDSNVKVNWHGAIKHNEIMRKMEENHIFILPTLGENFGHAISEAMIGGCPVIISDQTPWRNLEKKGVGWDINLNQSAKFLSSLQTCVDLDQENYLRLSKNAFNYSKTESNEKINLENYYKLFSQY